MKQRFVLALVCVGLEIVLAAQAPVGHWPQWRGPDRTGLQREGTVMIAEASQPSFAHPVVSGGRLYIRNHAR